MLVVSYLIKNYERMMRSSSSNMLEDCEVLYTCNDLVESEVFRL